MRSLKVLALALAVLLTSAGSAYADANFASSFQTIDAGSAPDRVRICHSLFNTGSDAAHAVQVTENLPVGLSAIDGSGDASLDGVPASFVFDASFAGMTTFYADDVIFPDQLMKMCFEAKVDFPQDPRVFSANSGYVYWTDASDMAGRNQPIPSSDVYFYDPATVMPVANDDVLATNEDTLTDLSSITANDTSGSSAGVLKIEQIVTQPAHGEVTLNAQTHEATYTPDPDFSGSDSFTYKVADDSGTSENAATVSLTVAPDNDKPSFTPDAGFTVAEDAPTTYFPVLSMASAGPADESQTLTFVTVQPPAHGTFSMTPEGGVQYRPDADYAGQDFFIVRAHDTDGAFAEQTINITVTQVNDDPTSIAKSVTTDEDTPATLDPFVGTTAGPLGEDALLQIDGLSAADHGEVSFDQDTGLIRYTPAADYYGIDYFSYILTDSDGATVAVPVPVNVASVNDAPTRGEVSLTTSMAKPVSFDVLDGAAAGPDNEDGQQLELIATTDPQHGTVTPGDASFITYTPADGFAGSDSFTFTLSDGDKQIEVPVSVQVAWKADMTAAVLDVPSTLPAGQTRTIKVTARNAGGDRDTAKVLVQTPEHTVLTPDSSLDCSTPQPDAAVCDTAALADGEQTELAFKVKANADAALGDAQVKATVQTYNAVDTDTSNDSRQATVKIVAAADLTVQRAVSAEQVKAGGQLTYTYKVANTGPSTAADVQLYAGFEGAAAVSGAPGCSAGDVISCPVGDLAAGASKNVTYTVTAGVAGTVIQDKVKATTSTDLVDEPAGAKTSGEITVSAGEQIIDPKPDPKPRPEDTPPLPIKVTPPSFDISQTFSTQVAGIGGIVFSKIQYVQLGSIKSSLTYTTFVFSMFNGVASAGQSDPGVEIISVSAPDGPCKIGPGTATCPIRGLNPGEKVQIDVKLRPLRAGQIASTVSASADGVKTVTLNSGQLTAKPPVIQKANKAALKGRVTSDRQVIGRDRVQSLRVRLNAKTRQLVLGARVCVRLPKGVKAFRAGEIRTMTGSLVKGARKGKVTKQGVCYTVARLNQRGVRIALAVRYAKRLTARPALQVTVTAPNTKTLKVTRTFKVR